MQNSQMKKKKGGKKKGEWRQLNTTTLLIRHNVRISFRISAQVATNTEKRKKKKQWKLAIRFVLKHHVNKREKKKFASLKALCALRVLVTYIFLSVIPLLIQPSPVCVIPYTSIIIMRKTLFLSTFLAECLDDSPQSAHTHTHTRTSAHAHAPHNSVHTCGVLVRAMNMPRARLRPHQAVNLTRERG